MLALGLGPQETLRVADLGCGLLPLLEEFRSLAKACGVRRLEYCGLEKEEGVVREACEVRGAGGGGEWGEEDGGLLYSRYSSLSLCLATFGVYDKHVGKCFYFYFYFLFLFYFIYFIFYFFSDVGFLFHVFLFCLFFLYFYLLQRISVFIPSDLYKVQYHSFAVILCFGMVWYSAIAG